MEIAARNVNDAFRLLVKLFRDYRPKRRYNLSMTYEDSRNGRVLRYNDPVLIHYERPTERVLFNQARDANPFFHLYEALWMLAGRNDLAPLQFYCSQYKEYSDDGETLNGAYGYRWRKAHTNQPDPNGQWGRLDEWPDTLVVDQLDNIVNHLKANPTSRRAVLNMWNVEDDLLKLDDSKDVCCNLNVMFSLHHYPDKGPECTCGADRTGSSAEAHKEGCPADVVRTVRPRTKLDITVTNRSNDMIWGLLGSNYVTFSILQEYMAARLGVEVGVYRHFTNNLHVYEWNWKPEEWLKEYEPQPVEGVPNISQVTIDPYMWVEPMRTVSLVKDPETFDEELKKVVNHFDGTVKGEKTDNLIYELTEPFLRDVAVPMLGAFTLRKLHKRPDNAMLLLDQVKAADWRKAAKEWMERRVKKDAS